ncbi:enoyl-CoA hydratase/isomerase family protein [Rhodococcus sp. NPDC056960]|jgi:enoyl-CoA hydratase|uniref:enoyl-CoA hydratase/isomerase family protein n=1 Tax=Rhodococcus sp. NPDC056960 TaxID=3345982 RepID=UPI0036388D89
MNHQVLRTSRQGAVAILELCRPAAKNSLNEELLTALNTELAHLRGDDTVRAVVLTGTEGVFCAGADITAFDALRAQPLLGARPALGGTLWADLGTYPKPVLAAVEGLALGGGCELALACDIVIAGESARFGVPEVKLGVIPGGGGTQRLIRAVGKSTALAMLLTGDVVSAQRASVAGMVADVVPDGEALAHAVAMAGRIANNSPLAVALAKDAALRVFETTLSQGLDHEKRNFDVSIRSADSHEGQAAFLAKRAPEFTGK